MRAICLMTFLIAILSLNVEGQNSQWRDQPLDSLVHDIEKLLLKDMDSTLILAGSVIRQARKDDNKYVEAKVRRIQIAALWLLGNYDEAMDSVSNSLALISLWMQGLEEGKEKRRLDDISIGILNEAGRLNSRQGKHDEAINAFMKAIKKLETKKQTPPIKENIAAITTNVAISYKASGKKLDSTILMYEKSLKIFKELNKPYYISGTYLNLGIATESKGDYKKALELYLEGLDLAEKNELHIQGNHLMAISSVYERLKDLDRALLYGKRCLSLVERQKNLPLQSHALMIVGTIYHNKNQFDSALYAYNKSLKISTSQNDVLNQGDAYQYIAKTYIKQNKYEEALSIINQGFGIMKGHSDQFIDLHLSLWKAKCLLKLGNPHSSLTIIKQALDLAEKSKNNVHRRNVYEVAHEIYSAIGNNAKAYQYLGQYSVYQDSVLAEEKTLEIARVEYDHQLKTETQRLQLEKDQQAELYEKELEKERLIQQAAIGGGVLVLIVLIMLYRSFQLKKLKNRQLTEKNIEISGLRETEKKMAEETIALKERELTTITMLSHERNSLLQQLGNQIGGLSEKVDEEVIPDLKEIKRTIKANLNEKSWSNFMYQFEKVHPEFFNQLKSKFPSLTQHDLRICAYLRVGMEKKEIATISNTTAEAVKKSLYRLKKKMELDVETDLREFLMKISGV